MLSGTSGKKFTTEWIARNRLHACEFQSDLIQNFVYCTSNFNSGKCGTTQLNMVDNVRFPDVKICNFIHTYDKTLTDDYTPRTAFLQIGFYLQFFEKCSKKTFYNEYKKHTYSHWITTFIKWWNFTYLTVTGKQKLAII